MPPYTAVTLPGARSFILRSTAGRQYRILLWVPDSPPPAAGFPVLYLLDANAVFATAVEAMRVQTRGKAGIAPAVIVGIGYPGTEPFPPERQEDFLLPEAQPAPAVAAKISERGLPLVGNALEFQAFLKRVLFPAIETEHPVDVSQRAILGHSLGGLFVLELLFTRTSLFRHYLAGSPSLHWDQQRMEAKEQTFCDQVSLHKERVHLLLAVEGEGREHISRLYDNTLELYERLRAQTGDHLRLDLKVFAEEGHVSMLPGFISSALRFAFGQESVISVE